MRNGYRAKSIACALLYHLESYLFLGEQRRRNPFILMLYVSVYVIVLVWEITENTGFILDILSALTKHKNGCCEARRDTEKGHCSLR
jgi:hypothetical protein